MKEIEHSIKEKGNYLLAVQSLPQKDDTNAWKKVNMATLRTLVKWTRRKGDNKLPTARLELQQRWNETQNRDEMTFNERLGAKKLPDEDLIAKILLDMSGSNITI